MIQARIRKQFAARHRVGRLLRSTWNLRPRDGFTVLFGPSGAGKTLTLDSIAGFVRPDEGRILLDDQILFDGAARVIFAPRERRCGYVFQNYALFPHMTLRQNLAFAAGAHSAPGTPPARSTRCWTHFISPRSPGAVPTSFREARSSAAPSPAR